MRLWLSDDFGPCVLHWIVILGDAGLGFVDCSDGFSLLFLRLGRRHFSIWSAARSLAHSLVRFLARPFVCSIQ